MTQVQGVKEAWQTTRLPTACSNEATERRLGEHSQPLLSSG